MATGQPVIIGLKHAPFNTEMHSHGSANERAHALRWSQTATRLKRLVDFGWPARSATILAGAVCLTSCVDAVAVVSDHPTSADVKVTQLTDGIAARFTSPERSGRFENARRRLVSGALIPSRIYDDTSVWSSSISPATRLLRAHGGLTDRGYRFDVAAETAALGKAGDSRHTIALRRLSDNEYRWDTVVDFAIGSLTAPDVAAMLVELLVSGHDHDATALRAGARTRFPRSSTVLAKVFSIDSLTTRPGGQGTTTIGMVLGIRPDGLRSTSPHFADYITRYVAKSHYRFTLADRNGAMYFDAIGADQRLTIRYRIKSGAIVSYLGPPRELPDSLRLTNDFSIHVKMFDVGWRSLVSDFIVHRTDHSRYWTMTAQSEPDWQLPMIAERLLRSPLRRPFQGGGATFEIGVIDSAGAQTNLTRRTHLEVKESAILRFLSGLVSRVVDDLAGAVEHEEAAYVRELMLAFQQDALRQAPR